MLAITLANKLAQIEVCRSGDDVARVGEGG